MSRQRATWEDTYGSGTRQQLIYDGSVFCWLSQTAVVLFNLINKWSASTTEPHPISTWKTYPSYFWAADLGCSSHEKQEVQTTVRDLHPANQLEAPTKILVKGINRSGSRSYPTEKCLRTKSKPPAYIHGICNRNERPCTGKNILILIWVIRQILSMKILWYKHSRITVESK